MKNEYISGSFWTFLLNQNEALANKFNEEGKLHVETTEIVPKLTTSVESHLYTEEDWNQVLKYWDDFIAIYHLQ